MQAVLVCPKARSSRLLLCLLLCQHLLPLLCDQHHELALAGRGVAPLLRFGVCRAMFLCKTGRTAVHSPSSILEQRVAQTRQSTDTSTHIQAVLVDIDRPCEKQASPQNARRRGVERKRSGARPACGGVRTGRPAMTSRGCCLGGAHILWRALRASANIVLPAGSCLIRCNCFQRMLAPHRLQQSVCRPLDLREPFRGRRSWVPAPGGKSSVNICQYRSKISTCCKSAQAIKKHKAIELLQVRVEFQR